MGHYGKCDPSCKSQVYNNVTAYNLASDMHKDLWNEHIFSLASLSGGHCHTYNPKNRSLAGHNGQFYAKLGLYKMYSKSILGFPGVLQL